MKETKIILTDLPKFSTNKLYSGSHWTFRKKMKDLYKVLIKSQYKGLFCKSYEYVVSYDFKFKNKPLDATNCSGMIKLIEDVLFEDDKFNIVKSVTIKSNKGKKDEVIILVKIIKN